MKNFLKDFGSLLLAFLWFVAVGKIAGRAIVFSANNIGGNNMAEILIKIAAVVIYMAVMLILSRKRKEPSGAYNDPEYRMEIVIGMGFISAAVVIFSRTSQSAEALEMVDKVFALGAFLAAMAFKSFYRIRNQENVSYVDKGAPNMWVFLMVITAICGFIGIILITPARGIISEKSYWFVNGVGFIYIAAVLDILLDYLFYAGNRGIA